MGVSLEACTTLSKGDLLCVALRMEALETSVAPAHLLHLCQEQEALDHTHVRFPACNVP